MTAVKTAPRPYKSGFCTKGNPTDSHDRCPQEYQGRPCVCDCHSVTVATVLDEPQLGLQVVGSIPANPHGFEPEVPEAEYHAHPGSLSQSGAKLLLRAPALFRHEQLHPAHKKVWDFGSAAHALVLGRGIESIYFAPFDSWQTKQAQTERKIAHDDGLSPILPKDWDQVCDMADVLSTHTLAMRLLSDGVPEVSAFAIDEPTGVMRRARFDWLGSTILTDYKTSTTADPKAFARSAPEYGYDMQAAWYLDIAADLDHPADAFAFIVQMKEPPYLVEVVELDADSVERGRRRNRRALEVFRDCTASNVWPGHQSPDQFTTVRLPEWALREEGIL